MKLFEIAADYRPSNPNKPKYYVSCIDKSQARRIFMQTISWLNIYKLEEITDDEKIRQIISHSEKYIVLGL